jgi:RNA polymerase sigma-70 factor (ECF subfamily)
VTDDGEPDDRRLLADHLAGDPDAFTGLVRRHRDRLWSIALRTLGDPEEAADALQDALISALRGAAGYRGDAAVTTWLHRIVVNACLDRIRRRQARRSVPLEGREVRARGDDHASTVTRLDVRSALARLPEPQRVALVLVDLEDLPIAEVAHLLGVAEGTVKSRCSRGRTAMAAMLSERQPDQLGRPDDGGNPSGGGGVEPVESAIRRAGPTGPVRPFGSGEGW